MALGEGVEPHGRQPAGQKPGVRTVGAPTSAQASTTTGRTRPAPPQKHTAPGEPLKGGSSVCFLSESPPLWPASRRPNPALVVEE